MPIGFTLYLTIFLVSISSNLIPKEINPNSYLPFSIPGLEIALSIIFISLIGFISLSFIGKKILQIINDLLKKIPFLRTIYGAIGQMTETFANKKGKKKSVVLVQYPSKGIWAVWYHLLGGVRHLIWDRAIGLDLKTAEYLGWSVIIGSFVFTILTIAVLW